MWNKIFNDEKTDVPDKALQIGCLLGKEGKYKADRH